MVTIIPHKLNIAGPSNISSTAAVLESKSFSISRKISAPGGGARRSLTSLGTNNAKLNLSLAQSNIAIVQDEFTSMWNFNPVTEMPLPPGIYQWATIISASVKNITSVLSEEVTKDIKLLKDITNPTVTTSVQPSLTSEDSNIHKNKLDVLENNSTVPTATTKHENSDNDDISDSENRKQVIRPSCEKVLVSTKKASSKSQICITEFFRPQKRKANYQCEGSTRPIKPVKKKLRIVH